MSKKDAINKISRDYPRDYPNFYQNQCIYLLCFTKLQFCTAISVRIHVESVHEAFFSTWKPTSLEWFSLDHVPSSFVLATLTNDFGPSPTEVKANNSNSYSVYLSSPVNVFERLVPFSTICLVSFPAEPFFQ